MIDTLQTVSSFLTPATLFILLNLVIATIVLSSRHHHQRSSHHPPDPMSGVPFAGGYHHFPLLRTTSPVLERLRSFTLHRFHSGEIPSPTDVHACSSPTRMSNPNPPPAESEPNSMDVNGSGDQGAAAAATTAAPSPPPPLARTSSILDKLKSINLYRFRSGEIQAEEVKSTAIATSTITEQHYGRSQSSESISRPAAKKKTVKKTASSAGGGGGGGDEEVMVRQRRSFRARDVAVEEEVDARADDFINRFKEQLKIQRLNSILNYKEMLNRGSN